MTTRNSGVQIGGHNYGAAAAGTNAHAASHGAAATDADQLAAVLAAIDGLRRLVESHADEVDDADLVARAIERMRAEVLEDRPDTDAVRDWLRRITQRVGAAAGLAGAVEEVRQLVGQLWPGS